MGSEMCIRDSEEGNDPWQRSKHALTHMWEEWDGMRDIVADEQPKVAPIDFSLAG